MHDPHKNPNYIFTTYLDLSHIFFSKTTSDVTLMGCYGNLLNSEMETISIETDFITLNDLLSEAGPQAEGTIEQIAKLLSQPSEENPVIDLYDQGGLHFADHIFSLMKILNSDEEGNIEESEEYSYRLLAYTGRDNIVPEFIDFDPPVTYQEHLTYFNSLFAMQYHLYLSCRKKLDQPTALIYSNLTDRLAFNLAKTQYEFQKSGQTN
jgi:hypothetical protein